MIFLKIGANKMADTSLLNNKYAPQDRLNASERFKLFGEYGNELAQSQIEFMAYILELGNEGMHLERGFDTILPHAADDLLSGDYIFIGADRKLRLTKDGKHTIGRELKEGARLIGI